MARIDLSRRGFLAATGAGFLPVSGLLPARAPGKEPGAAMLPPLKLGLVTYNLARSWDVETIIKNCAEARFEDIGELVRQMDADSAMAREALAPPSLRA